MESYYPIGEITKSFSEQFPDSQLEYQSVGFNKAVVHCFFAHAPNEEWLGENWVKTSNFIAMSFQRLLSNEFEKWNIYLFLLTDEEISTALQYAIENDTFSSRKTIISSNKDIAKIIDEHILNTDLRINTIDVQEDFFDADPLLNEILTGIPPAKKVTQGIKNALEIIIKKVREQNNEI